MVSKKPSREEVAEAVSQDSKENTLTAKQELFCELFVSKDFFGNGTQAYIAAYDLEITKPGVYATARASASENLTKPNILARIDELLTDWGLNDQHADKQLWLAMTQNTEMGPKVAAIRQYNDMKKRINGEPVPVGEITVTIKHVHTTQEEIT